MTWTYAAGMATDKDVVRFMIGDTDTTDQLVADEDVAGNLALYGSTFRAAAAVCRHLAARFSRQADIAEDDLSKKLSQRAKAFADRAVELDDLATSANSVLAVPLPYAGGISFSDKETREADTDRVRPFVTRETDEFPGGGSGTVSPVPQED